MVDQGRAYTQQSHSAFYSGEEYGQGDDHSAQWNLPWANEPQYFQPVPVGSNDYCMAPILALRLEIAKMMDHG